MSIALGLIGLTIHNTAYASEHLIDRENILKKKSPEITQTIPESPFSLGNGKFAYTADVTGFQNFADEYFTAGFPLETKARWAWHTRKGESHQLAETYQTFSAYGRQIQLPTESDTAAALWLRENPHDLPLGKIILLLDTKPVVSTNISQVQQRLDLWRGELSSQYLLDKQSIITHSSIHADRDLLGFHIQSSLLKKGRLSFRIKFPRAYDLSLKNTPDIDWNHDDEHKTTSIQTSDQGIILKREIDDATYFVKINVKNAKIIQDKVHEITILPLQAENNFEFSIEYIQTLNPENVYFSYRDIAQSAKNFWKHYWEAGAFVDFSGSTNAHAAELQRRILLSQYLLAAQARATIPTQETGLTSSSWYGKFHTEMSWWHNAHWILWNHPTYAEPMLEWYLAHLGVAQNVARERGLQGARWPKMVSSEARESPGNNAFIIWNQPQAIHLAEFFFQKNHDKKNLQKYADLVEQTAQAMSSMLTWNPDKKQFDLDAPIWIAQEIYDPTQTKNPTFELAYWRYGLQTAQNWRVRLGLEKNTTWQNQLDHLAALPIKNNKYVATESIPDTFDNRASREDHPSFLAATALLNDASIDSKIMANTLAAVIHEWQFDQRIWGWDYPMLAMTAARLNRPELAIDLLLKESANNRYLTNGNCPQSGANLPTYLPANAALLTAVALMLEKDPKTGHYLGFPNNGRWKIRAEGFENNWF